MSSKTIKLFAVLGLVLGVAWLDRSEVSARVEPMQPPKIDFNRDIRPILSDNCFACHGPDESKRMAGLRFDTRDGAFRKAGLIVANDPSNSILYQRISASDKTRVMPPVDSGYALTTAQIELIRKWIEQGAVWTGHWAYLPPTKSEQPKVKQQAWPRNAIDHFILARLEREGLAPSPEADLTTLLRRVTLDLTGLPPTPLEVDSFLADRAPGAYERRVDELLRSPAYGERMAMQWLDLARYADTHGYHIDSHRDMWPWRDWLIAAFNNNLPYDKFTIEQLAGDLLPGATLEQQIASGFNRNHMINYEGGAIPEEYQVEYVIDRVETTATTWLGMTMGCARCHTHKYDPITQKEFYQFFAFFNNVAEEGLDGRLGNAKPMLQLPTELQKQRLEELNRKIKAAEEALVEKEVAPLEMAWSQPFIGKIAEAPRAGLVAHYELDGNFSDLSGRLQHGHVVRGDPTFATAAIGRGVAFDGDSQVEFGNIGEFERGDAFTLSFWMRTGSNQPLSFIQKIENSESRRGYEVGIEDRELIGIQRWAQRLMFRMSSKWPQNAIQVRSAKRIAMGDWFHVALAYDGSGRAQGLRLHINGTEHQLEVAHDSLTDSIRNREPLQVGNRQLGRPFNGGLDDLRIYSRNLAKNEVEQLAVTYPVQVILSGLLGKRTKDEETRLRDYFLTAAAPEPLRQRAAELKALKRDRDQLNKETLTVMVMGERERPRETFILGRGDYRNRTEKVTADVPAVLPQLPSGGPRNRLALAKWLVDGRNPLVARVAVNRFWQNYFGFGIVKTAEDFGSQGDPPIHPELLDWLSLEFVRSGWDVKAMQRLIVTSAAYRQTSKVTPALLEKDPENRFLSRGPRHRMPAEMIRDNALAASGLLNREIGGPSVYPYQPPGLWEEMAFGDGFSAQQYEPSTGKDLYRRSMYTFWKRTVPPAAFATFDAPDREKCTVRRPVTNTPLQALVVLNDPTYIESARALAERAFRDGGKDAGSRLAYAFRLVTGRRPSAKELEIIGSLLTRETSRYRKDRAAALKLVAVGQRRAPAELDVVELAAWTVVASTLLNLDEVLTKE